MCGWNPQEARLRRWLVKTMGLTIGPDGLSYLNIKRPHRGEKGMKHMSLLEMVKEYQVLLEDKDRLAAMTKENNAAIEAAKEKIAQQMIDDDCPKISTGGYTFSLQAKTAYSKRSEADLAETGADFLGTLREEGLGDIIVESVNSRTLQSAISAYVEEHGELSEALGAVISTYEYNDVTRRKEARRRKA